MKKRIITIISAVIALAAVLAASMLPASAATESFQVGFSRVDINPYVQDGVFSKNLMALPLSGNGDVWNRLSTDPLYDDNGDGKVDKNDGLSATCIAISDENGQTVLLITADLIDGYLHSRVRDEIIARLNAEKSKGQLTDVTLSRDQIYYTGTHTHTAPDIPCYSEKVTGNNKDGVSLSEVHSNLGIWINRTVEDIGDAAVAALKDRAAATVTKDSISASSDTKAPVSGKVLNTVRHYFNAELGCYAGDNFNDRGDNPKQVTDVNDTLYMLKFDFTEHNAETGDNKLPIIYANWRGHATANNQNTKYSSRNAISSDYFNAFRYALEYNCTISSNGKGTSSGKQVYRVALFNSASGNVNTYGREVVGGKETGKWIDEMSEANKECRGNGYGRILCALAQHGLSSSQNRETVSYGEIKTMRYDHYFVMNDSNNSALAHEAAKAYQANPSVTLPYAYKNSAGQVFVIGSNHQANYLVSRWDKQYQTPKEDRMRMELSTILIGEDLAFVSVPGEAFDYYYNPDGSNAWKNLAKGETYGTPFVLGYCNGSLNYIPNDRAYTYNQGSTKYQTGSYEASIAYVPRGTGEHMIELFDKMLDMTAQNVTAGDWEYCEHCKRNVRWYPFNGQTDMNAGHYYLIDNMYGQITPKADAQVCFDLRGYTLRGEKRAIDTTSNGNVVISIMDTSEGKTGRVEGCGGLTGVISGYGGAAVIVHSGSTLNIYGGTIGTYDRKNYSVYFAGTMVIMGEVNMYGGVIEGGKSSSFSGRYIGDTSAVPFTREANSGTVFVYSNATFGIYGGQVKNGQFRHITGTVTGSSSAGFVYTEAVQVSTGIDPCINSQGKIILGGDSKVDHIYFPGGSESRLYIDTSEKPFTGTVELLLPNITQRMNIGKCTEGTVLPENAITFTDAEYPIVVNGENIQILCQVAICGADGNEVYYSTMDAALTAYSSAPAGSYLRLVSDCAEALTIKQDMYLDLNGYSISGKITVNKGCVLYCMDSATDDYTVADGRYGRLTGSRVGEGEIKGVPINTVSALQEGRYRDGYMMIQKDTDLSFHRVKIRVTTISLRPSAAGLYYTGSFGGDEMVEGGVLDFGTAFSVVTDPVWGDDTSVWVKKETSDWTNDGTVTSVLVKDVMKAGVTDNADRAKMPIYGRAYVRTAQGFMYSNVIKYSLQQLAETADATGAIQDKGMDHMVTMYKKFDTVMDKWMISSVFSNMSAQENEFYEQNQIHFAAEKMTEDKVFASGREVTAVCPVCGTEKRWVNLNTYGATTVAIDGHYYLSDNLSDSNGYSFKANACLHLNGNNITASSKAAIYVNAKDSTTPYVLNIMGEGVVSGKGVANSTINRGGAIDNSGNVNLYGGTYKSSNDMPVICGRGYNLYSDMQVYDGVQIISEETYTQPTIWVRATDVFIYGGTVTGGNGHAIRTGGGYANTIITGGTITNETTDVYTVFIDVPFTHDGVVKATNVKVDISGGTIAGGGVYVDTNVKTVSVSGRAVVSNLDLTNGKKLTLGELKGGAQIGVTAADGAFTNASESAASYLDHFIAIQSGKCVKAENNTLVIANA